MLCTVIHDASKITFKFKVPAYLGCHIVGPSSQGQEVSLQGLATSPGLGPVGPRPGNEYIVIIIYWISRVVYHGDVIRFTTTHKKLNKM